MPRRGIPKEVSSEAANAEGRRDTLFFFKNQKLVTTATENGRGETTADQTERHGTETSTYRQPRRAKPSGRDGCVQEQTPAGR